VGKGGFVKYHRQALHKSSTLRQVSRADRATLLDYIALARWQAPFAGCLCDEAGVPWSRERRAEEVGEGYGAIKRTEENLLKAGLITFQQKGAAGKASIGRVHIVNFAKYQVRNCPPKTKGEELNAPSQSEGPPFENGEETLHNRRENPSEVKGPTFDEPPSENEGSTPQRLMPDEAPDDATSEEGPSENGGEPIQDVKTFKNTAVEGEPPVASPSLKDKVCKVLAPLTGGVGPGLVQTVENALYPSGAKDVILVVAMELAARHADGQNVNISWLAGNVLDRIQREEDRSANNDAEVQDPTTIVKQYPVWKLEQGKTDNKGLTANNMTCTWDDPRNVLVTQLEEAVAHERTHA